MPLCPPQSPHAARTRTWAAAVGSQRLTTWAMAWPFKFLLYLVSLFHVVVSCEWM
jgi:hypothetical protein